MGFFWDLLQQSQISDQKQKTSGMDDRIARLEHEMYRTQQLLHNLIQALETKFGEDLDRDGRIG